MRRKTNTRLNAHFPSDPTLMASEEMQSYCLTHPRSPSARRRPQLSSRGDLWIALLGPNVEKGIVGIGPSVEAALRAFDARYLDFLAPPTKPKNSRGSSYRNGNRAARVDQVFLC
jgi:hypothetical protein